MDMDCGIFKLRDLQAEDRESMAFYANNANIWRNLRDYFPHPYNLSDAAAFIACCRHAQPATHWCIELNKQCVGVIGFIPQQDVYRKSADFGYWLGEPFWGRGIMTTAVQKTTAYIFTHFDVVRIFAGIFEWNKASMRVLEKAGFRQEGIFEKAVFKDGQLINEYRYSLLKPFVK